MDIRYLSPDRYPDLKGVCKSHFKSAVICLSDGGCGNIRQDLSGLRQTKGGRSGSRFKITSVSGSFVLSLFDRILAPFCWKAWLAASIIYASNGLFKKTYVREVITISISLCVGDGCNYSKCESSNSYSGAGCRRIKFQYQLTVDRCCRL